jgi:D-sedoheptulose 7-phosphate isomerase
MEEAYPHAIVVSPATARDRAVSQGHHRANLTTAIHARQGQLAAALGQLACRTAALAAVTDHLIAALRDGRKVLVAGNGGSAAEAQHFVAELVGRFQHERDPYPAIALTADSATLTAVANDYGYAEVFARQVRALGQVGDILVLFSTSGESENLVRAAQAGRQRRLTTVAITGDHPNRLAGLADLAVRVPATETAIVQELHQIVTHLLCGVVEAALMATDRALSPHQRAQDTGESWAVEGRRE